MLSVTAQLALRALLLVRRMPSVFIPSLAMPLFILIATAGAFSGIGALPAFGGRPYLAFVVPLAALMGGGFAGINAGSNLARDIESGFVDRMLASPAPRAALVLGPLLAAVVRSAFTTTLVLTAGWIGGVTPSGVLGALFVYLIAAMFCAATACWAIGVALRSRSVQSVPLMQVAVFVAIFSSVMYVPREALDGWLRAVADWNPVTYMLEAARSAEAGGSAWADLGPGLLAGAGLIAALAVFAGRGLRRLAR